jgi:asparagine synthase (glutamine-hydrolysing)
MCGIAGAMGPFDDLPGMVSAMTRRVAHRGPDGHGVWVDPGGALALGHRRLSIQDLSPTGAQPMMSAKGRFTVVYNGEIYNAPALRDELRPLGHMFRGTSDTEVLLAAVAQWGLVPALERFVGMFAIALWDRAERTLTLVRDRLGIKPLYWAAAGRRFVFGSELSTVRSAPFVSGAISHDAAAMLLRFACVPAPHTILEGVHKLQPGHLMVVRDGVPERPVAWWRVSDVFDRADPWTGSEEEAIDAVDAAVRDAVSARLLSDVPLGGFLSGGVDSSTVAAMMAATAGRVRTFCIGSEDPLYDESKHAAAVAAHLGTDHETLVLTGADALALVPRLPQVYDEPFADSSQVPTTLLCAATRKHVTVCLSGDGGDEVFAGYNRYVEAPRLWRRASRVPAFARGLGARALEGVPIRTWDRVFRGLGGVLPRRVTSRPAGITVPKIAGVLGATDQASLYRFLTSGWLDPTSAVPGARDRATAWDLPPGPQDGASFVRRMQVADLSGYTQDDILTKVDRASMATALEVRVPLLDHRVIALAARFPLSLHHADGRGKYLLRRVLDRYVPRALVDRPKQGFGLPITEWLRTDLRAWAEDLLTPDALARDGLFDPAPIRAKWAEHLSGRRSWTPALWSVLMLQAWRA